MSRIAALKKKLLSPLTWHIAGASALFVLVVILSIRFGLDWSATNNSSANALATKQVQLRAIEIQTAPLRGLDQRVEDSRKQMMEFYSRRIPANYSTIAYRVGDLAVKSPVRLSRVQYAQGIPGADFTEISLDAGISGEYPGIMRFVNGLERDPNFFVIRAMALTGQQGGQVGLRLRVSTWMRPADAAASLIPNEAVETTGMESPAEGTSTPRATTPSRLAAGGR